MKKFFFFITLLGVLSAYIAYKYGFFSKDSPTNNAVSQFLQLPQPTPLPTIINLEPTPASKSGTITILTATDSARLSSLPTISWKIDSSVASETARTAVQFGPVSIAHPVSFSDYPEKSIIQKGPLTATFSAQLRFPKTGIYYYRVNAVINGESIWSDEASIAVFDTSTASSSLR